MQYYPSQCVVALLKDFRFLDNLMWHDKLIHLLGTIKTREK